MADSFDLIVARGRTGGQSGFLTASKSELKTVLVERDNFGGYVTGSWMLSFKITDRSY